MIRNTTHLSGEQEKKNAEKLSVRLKQYFRIVQLTKGLELYSATVTLACLADIHVNT